MTTSTKTQWKIDSRHSEIQFKVRHLAISNVAGTFKEFEGEAACDNDSFDHAKITVVIDAGSIDTNNPDRDKHLKSADFFNVGVFPRITFEGELQPGDAAYALTGHLTIGAITREVHLDAELAGTGTGRFGDTRAGFEVTGKINRKDFGLGWNILTEAGGLVLGDEIKLHFDIQLVKA